jgi:putative transposase
VAVQHERVANQRRDFHHQVSRRVVNTYGIIALESLYVKGMMANHALAKSIADAGWSQFVTFLQYKQQWAGGAVIQADRWFPSSKSCSACGAIHQGLTLSERNWTCSGCGAWHDRDINAAQNLLNILTVSSRSADTYRWSDGKGSRRLQRLWRSPCRWSDEFVNGRSAQEAQQL